MSENLKAVMPYGKNQTEFDFQNADISHKVTECRAWQLNLYFSISQMIAMFSPDINNNNSIDKNQSDIAEYNEEKKENGNF